MERSKSLTVAASVVLVIGILTSALSLFMMAYVQRPQMRELVIHTIIIAAFAPLLVVGLLEIATGIGLFRRQSWSRKAALVISGFFAVISSLMVLISLFGLLAADKMVSIISMIQALPLALIFIWLFRLFKRETIKSQFVAED